MTFAEVLILLTAGLTSGLMNSVAGGGSFVAFPALIFLGLSSIEANATATLAIFPGTFATMMTYRKELLIHKEKLPFVVSVSLIGGMFGAMILLSISNTTFSNIVPYLLLLATILFTFRATIIGFIRKISGHFGGSTNGFFYRTFMAILFIAISVYGGFFGAGMGILLLALFSLMGMQSIHEMNALRSCCGLFANAIAVIMFGISGIIIWKSAAIMAVGCIIGGYFGASYALRMPQVWSRNAVIIIAWTMTIYFFWKQWV